MLQIPAEMKNIFLFVFLLSVSLAGYGQDITGVWNGILKVQGIQLRIVFNISKANTGYSSTMDSPDQGAKGIPVSSTVFDGLKLKLDLPNLGITYEGTLKNDTMFIGTFKQAGLNLPLALTRSEAKKEKLNRPQEPKKPYPYYSEEVTFTNGKDGVRLAGTLTMPEKEGRYPAVILISGSGAQNRNEELMGHKPFLVLADYLTRHGIAVLRYDDRGVGGSTGNYPSATTKDLANDARAALTYLLGRKEIDKKHTGLLGHSEGGIIASMVAAGSREVSFIVLLAAPGVPGKEILIMQQKELAKAAGVSDSVINEIETMNRACYNIVLSNNDEKEMKDKLFAYLKKSLTRLESKSLAPDVDIDEYAAMQVKQMTSPWMRFFLEYDPANALEKVKCPVLALDGSKDMQVNAAVNLKAIKEALEKAGNKDVTVKELPGLNHLFQECKTGLPYEYSMIEQTFSPVALNIISDWISEHVKK